MRFPLLLALLGFSCSAQQGIFAPAKLEATGYGAGFGTSILGPSQKYFFGFYAHDTAANVYAYSSAHLEGGKFSIIAGGRKAVASVGRCTFFVGGGAGATTTATNLGNAFGGDADALCRGNSALGGTFYHGFGASALKTSVGLSGISLKVRYELIFVR